MAPTKVSFVNPTPLVKHVNMILFMLVVIIVPSSHSDLSQDHDNPSKNSQFTEISAELQKMLDEIGGPDREIDFALKDYLILPPYTPKEIEDYHVRHPKYADLSWATSYNEIPIDGFMNKITHMQEEIETYAVMQAEFQDVLDLEIIPEIALAIRQFYQVKDMSEFIGINQDFRDNVLKMVRMAKNNIDLIYEKYHKYQDPIRAKKFRSLAELEEAIRENLEEYKLGRLPRVGQVDQAIVDTMLHFLGECQDKERTIRKKLNTFLKEEINVIRLGVEIWHGSQIDFTLEDEEKLRKEEMVASEVAKNTELNRIRRQLITDINLSRSKLKNATDAGTKGGDDGSTAKNVRHNVRVEL